VHLSTQYKTRLVCMGLVFGLLLLGITSALSAQESKNKFPHFEIGGQFIALNIPSSRVGCGGCRVYNSGLGVNVGANLRSWFGLDAALNFFPDPGSGADNLQGGRITQGLFGVKLGFRRDRWGVFAKARPGFVSFGRAITGVVQGPPPSFSFQFGRLTHFATDLGGIFEYYPSSRIAFRLDLGNTLVRYQTSAGSFTQGNFQVSTGVVFRF